jgi:hypothetical protein
MRKLFLLFLLAPLAFGQNVRYDAPFPSISSSTSTPYLLANIPPNSPVLAVCNSPANAVPCTNYAQVFTSTGATCPSGSQDTPQPQPSACQSTGDAQGNIGWWAPPGRYDYTVCVANSCFGPYTVTLGGSGGACIGANPGDLCYYDGAHWTVLTGNTTTPPARTNIVLTEDESGVPSWIDAALAVAKSCQTGLGDGLNAIPSGTYPQFFCVNNSGLSLQITAIHCYTDNAGSSTLDAKNNAGTSYLTAPITCNNTKTGGGQAGSLNLTIGTIPNLDAVNFSFISDGASTQTTWTVDSTTLSP